MTGEADELASGSHISGSTTAVIVRWVRNQRGDEGVAQLLAKAGEARSAEQLEDISQWSSYRQATALLEAAVEVTGRTDAARRIGEEMLVQHRGTAVVDLLRSLGSPEALLASITESASKFSTVFAMTPEEVVPGHALVVGTTPPGVPRHRLLCDFTLGILSIIPTVFDLAPAVVTQSQCQARGGARCVYTLSWNPTAVNGLSGDAQRVQSLENQVDGLQMHLNALRATAAEVVEATDVDGALEMVTRRAGQGVRATRYLLAVRMPASSRLRVHACGMSPEEAQVLAPTLVEQTDDASRLVVEVASATRHYGVLAALFPPGARFFREERDNLSTYAGYAASILDTAWAIEDARRQNETARALLDLSRALAEVAAPAEVAQRLADVVPRVVDCDMSSVLLWHEDEQLLRLAGSHNLPRGVARSLAEEGIGLTDTPAMGEMLQRLEPLFLQPSDADPFVQDVLRRSECLAAVVVPILGRGKFLGIVTAAVVADLGRLERTHDLLERLEGLASQAATSLTNASLVRELQRQALHDPVTGLANRVALVRNMERALAHSRRTGTQCALLFLDLDRFKHVNDTLGHLAGDELLVQVAQRLGTTVRGSDTIARLGGDEFGVLLPSIGDEHEPERVAERILDALRAPFVLNSVHPTATVSIGASIGVCSGMQGRAGTVDMLREADSAMYLAKALGGDRCGRADVPVPRRAEDEGTADIHHACGA